MELTFYQVLCLIGVPSLATVIGWIYKKLKKTNEEIRSVKLGLQALLRSQMINDYNLWSEKQFAPIHARESFENCWKQYHSLGANGVMDDVHEKFMSLPARPTKGDAGVDDESNNI